MSLASAVLGHPVFWEKKAEALLLKWEDLHLHTIQKTPMDLEMAKKFILAREDGEDPVFDKALPWIAGSLYPRARKELTAFAANNQSLSKADPAVLCPPSSLQACVSSLLVKDIGLIHETLFDLTTAKIDDLVIGVPDEIFAKDASCRPASKTFLAAGAFRNTPYESLREEVSDEGRSAFYRVYLGEPALEYMQNKDTAFFASLARPEKKDEERVIKRSAFEEENKAIKFLLNGNILFHYALYHEKFSHDSAHEEMRAVGALRSVAAGDILMLASRGRGMAGSSFCSRPMAERPAVGVHFQTGAPMGPK